MFCATSAKRALAMHRNLYPNGCRPEVRDLAQKLNWAVRIAVFHFAIRWTHGAQRLNPTLHAFRNPCPLSISQLQQGVFPYRPEPRPIYTECLLLRNHTDADLSVRVYGERVHPSATEIGGVDLP